jgi:hypothetical protein
VAHDDASLRQQSPIARACQENIILHAPSRKQEIHHDEAALRAAHQLATVDGELAARGTTGKPHVKLGMKKTFTVK